MTSLGAPIWQGRTRSPSGFFYFGLAVAVAINAGLLSLGMTWRTPVEEPTAAQAIDVILLPPIRRPTVRQRAISPPRLHVPGAVLSSAPPAAVFAQPEGDAHPGPQTHGDAPAVEPRWQVDGGAYLDPETAKQARALFEMKERLRFERACMGLSSETMTSDEREICYRRWNARAGGQAR